MKTGRIATFTGFLAEHTAGGADNILFLSDHEEPVAALLDGLGWGNSIQVSVRYWVSGRRATKAEFMEQNAKSLLGGLKTDWGVHYSDVTGYLWTDEAATVGGHDLLAELRTHLGKFCHLEIEVAGGKP